MDVARLREDFPILRRTFHGHPLIYLDSAATSQKPTVVTQAEKEFYETRNANPHRGVYGLSEEATDVYEHARERVAQFLHTPDTGGVVFVRGTTEALNLVASSIGTTFLHRGDHVVATLMEHHSNIVPWHLQRVHRGIVLDFVNIDGQGRLDLDDLDRKLAVRPKVVTVTHVSNVLGTINPIREIADRAHAVGALVVVDAAQSAPHLRIDVTKLDVDFLAFSGHKTLGPTGIGVLWGRPELLEKMEPFMGGGQMIEEVFPDRITYREAPARFEPGTPNVAGAYGLTVALDYLEAVGWDDLRDHERSLRQRAYAHALDRMEGRVTIVGPTEDSERTSVMSFTLEGAHPHDVASLLDAEGIAIRSGAHCGQPLMQRLGVQALCRASPYLYNTLEEIDELFTALEKTERILRKQAPPSSIAS
ncbi:MAG: SufS family cysteine desulfurase [Thermoplasmata archaeon]